MGQAVDDVLQRGFAFTVGAVAVRLASPRDLEELAELFDGYRVFYRQPADRARARQFIEERIALHESVVLVVDGDAGRLDGFTQLFPSFTSSGTARTWLLNDLFVRPEARRRGVGRALVTAAIELGRRTGAAAVSLATEQTNVTAQPLYEALGFERDTAFLYYRRRIG